MTAKLSNELIQQHQSKPRMKGVKVPDAVAVSYLADMRRIIKTVERDVNERLKPVIKSTENEYTADSLTNDGWLDLVRGALDYLKRKWTGLNFDSVANRLSTEFVTTANATNARQSRRDLGIDIFSGNPQLVEYLRASAYDNAQLIKSIPEQYLGRVESAVMANMRAGNRSTAIIAELKKAYDITDKRAKMIARDQTAKINGELTKKRQVAAGFDYFQWIDSDDSRVRTRHHEISERVTAYGKGVYRWDSPPLSDKGEPIIPGSDYQCRCFAKGYPNEQVAKNQREGKVNPSVKR